MDITKFGPNAGTFPLDLIQGIIIDCGGMCPIPRCSDAIWDFYPINSGNSEAIGLCHQHFSLAKAKVFSLKMLKTIVQLLRGDRFSRNKKSMHFLETRERFLEECVKQLYNTGSNFCLTYVGPLCLHPDWYHDRRDQKRKHINMDKPIREYLRVFGGKPADDIRIIFRNTPRYLEKVRAMISPTEGDALVEGMLAEIEKIWGDDDSLGPRITCLDTGFLHIPIIYNNTIITTSRQSSMSPVTEGVLHLDDDLVKVERERFNLIFDENHRGQRKEIQELKRFIKQIPKKL